MTAQQLEANYACAADTSTAPHLEGMSDSSRSGKKAKEFVLDYLVLDREQCCHPVCQRLICITIPLLI